MDLRRASCSSACSTSYAPAAPRSGPLVAARRLASRRSALPVARASPYDVFDAMDRQFMEMDRQFDAMQRQMDREFESAFSRAREAERQALSDSAAAQRSSSRQEQQQQLRPYYNNNAPEVDITRQEERGAGYYRYYERIQITGGGGGRAYGSATPAPAAAVSLSPTAAGPGPAVLLGVAVVVGGYAALTAAFARNYQLTNYAESKRWLLLALWPLLFLFSPKFREQFSAAVKGQRVRATGGGGAQRPDGL
ncbi:hypothetical protein HYH02_003258 [Chlamydomonas schloesseri]|uniref:Uncharacterized protein n=1 Tax=Chlamydomonas schloesseri TaxID=2026947 RepID=A0A835WR83_9CHLO|nr:hypothetical protein HYH02_003258 [Chlamydomonas schloesseri]|eukprot:KAG2452230.1 hypothetical protein HYH02_003258 [Chlamydomonas schloesseri]